MKNLILLLVLFGSFCISACGSSNETPDGDIDIIENETENEIETDTDDSTDGDLDAPEMEIEENSEFAENEELEPELESEIELEEETEPALWEVTESSAPTLQSILGVSTHMKQSEGENAHRDFEFEKYVELGGIRIREDYHWHKIEPEDDQWTFDPVDTQVQMAKARNIKVLPMMAYTVDWAFTEEGNYSSIDPMVYAQYAAKVAEQYCDYIKEYEVWNEPNINRFWKPDVDMAHYALFLKQSYIEIKKVCPDARVATGGLAGYDFTENAFNRWWTLDAMAEAVPDICDYFDIFSFHPYTWMQQVPPEKDWEITQGTWAESLPEMMRLAREKLASIGCKDKAFWATEAGWPSYDLISEEDQTTYSLDNEMVQGIWLPRGVLLAAMDNVEAYFWYTFWDGEPITEGLRPHENYFGLFGYRGEDGTTRRAKPGWETMKALVTVAGESRFVRNLSNVLGLPSDVYVLLFAEDDNTLILAMWDGRDVPDVTIADGTLEGGWDTTYDLTMDLPEGVTGLALYNIFAEEQTAPTTLDKFSLTLNHKVQYLVIER